MTYIELFEKMRSHDMVSDYWKHVLALLDEHIEDQPGKDEDLKLFLLYFSLQHDGNVYMSLDRNELEKKVDGMIEGLTVQYEEEGEETNQKTSFKVTELQTIGAELKNALLHLDDLSKLASVVSADPSEQKLFVIREKRLFLRKFDKAVQTSLSSADRLFRNHASTGTVPSFDISKYGTKFPLSPEQNEIIQKGITNNLLVTGGPGTGKTYSVFYLLLALLEQHPEYNIYLAAPSGKAAARMKESIQGCAAGVNHPENGNVKKILSLEEFTIHRLLGTSPGNRGFIYTAKNQFPENSVFVIDESSMIDVQIFASLLEAIPDNARVFFLGDKDQLPSVECGAVFAELLQHVGSENKVTLVTSHRFKNTSEIYRLAQAVNGAEQELPVKYTDWKDCTVFDVQKKQSDQETPIYYYDDRSLTGKCSDNIAEKWAKAFYTQLPNKCCGLPDSAKEAVIKALGEITSIEANARILCANNTGVRGVHHMNDAILTHLFSGKKMISGFYPGELVMITSNNHSLNLYNGDCGAAVTFRNAPEILYLMFQKDTTLQLTDGGDPAENKIFKIGKYVFYPAHLVNREEVVPAFAITIHKSQGSDYGNILVLLPKKKGHPLLNRQIVYTAITRTTESTYIISNQENLEYARNKKITRDTGLL